MGQTFLIMILTIVICGTCASAQGRHEGHCRHDQFRQEYRHRHSPYFITDDKVFFEGRRIDGATASSFQILHDGYAKDTWTVYYCGEKINGASAESFKVLGYGYAKDTWNVYFDG